MEKSYTGIGIAVVLLIIVAMAALIVPSLGHTHGHSQDTGAAQTLKSLTSTQATWFNVDTDRNGIKDYWTVDISGFYRVMDDTGNPAQVLDISFARSDWHPAAPGGTTPVIGAHLTATGAEPVAKSGYYYAAFLYDENGKAYAQDLNGDGYAYENAGHYAFQTFPDKYASSGKLAFIINESAVVYKIEAITAETGMNMGKSFNDPKTLLPSTAAPKVPVPYWPAVNPTGAGYASVE